LFLCDGGEPKSVPDCSTLDVHVGGVAKGGHIPEGVVCSDDYAEAAFGVVGVVHDSLNVWYLWLAFGP